MATITSKRVILRTPSMLRIKKSYVDYSYADITNIVLDRGPLRSTIMLDLKMDVNDLVIEDIPNDMAQQAFPAHPGRHRSGKGNRRSLRRIFLTLERSDFYSRGTNCWQ